MYTCVCKIPRIVRFGHHGRRVPREVTDMAGNRSADSTAQRRRVEQGADN